MRVPLNWLRDYLSIDLPAKEIADRLTMIGHALDKPLEDPDGEVVMEFEDRGNRADALGILGLARDLAASLNTPLRYPTQSPIPASDNKSFRPKITVLSDKVHRFRAVVIRGIKVEPSPEMIRRKLKSYGIEPINNIVDITNFVMVETGMPLHAFDLDKVGQLILRPAKEGEILVTFDGSRLILNEQDLVAADHHGPLTLTTAVGGRESGVNDKTQNILLEAGLYDQPTARHSSARHRLRNETSQRLGKYLHPEFCDVAIARTLYLIKESTTGQVGEVSYDYYPAPVENVLIDLPAERLDLIAGETIHLNEAASILQRLEFKIQSSKPHRLVVAVPYFRTDVRMADDLVEEVLRIRGFDKIKPALPARPSPAKLIFPEMDLENRARDLLIRLGFNEVVGQPIVDVKDIQKTGLWDRGRIIRLENSWNEELNVMRSELISTQLKYVSSYVKEGIERIRLFEVGKTYAKVPGNGLNQYQETRKIGLSANLDFGEFKSYLLTFLWELGFNKVSFEKLEFPAFKTGRSASLRAGGRVIGKLGTLKSSVLNDFGLGLEISHTVFYVTEIIKSLPSDQHINISTKRENFISQDFTVTISRKDLIGDLVEKMSKKLEPLDKISFRGGYCDEELTVKSQKRVTFNLKFFGNQAAIRSQEFSRWLTRTIK